MKNPFANQDFLKKLSDLKHRENYVRIISLDYLTNEPIEYIEGKITGGSINIDGNSAVRRSCSITLVTNKDTKFTEPYWAFKNKFQVEIGQLNTIDSNYPEIIWFPQGTYIISSFSATESLNNLTISIQGKDKMCLLNGEIGGSLFSETNFGILEEYDRETNITTKTKLPIKSIIQNALLNYAHERIENIIINDLEEYAYELWEYQGDTDLYLILNENNQITNYVLDGEIKIQEIASDNSYGDEKKLSEISKYYSMDTLDITYNDDVPFIVFVGENSQKKYKICKVSYGETAGYHQTPLVYNSDLILNAGESITSLLDKIKNMLGEFEYFYDLQGRFVFQKKKTYIAELFSPINGEIVEPTMVLSPYAYRFEDWSKFSNMPNSPNISNIKNDFVIWGNRKSSGGMNLPIHARYALQKKPEIYIAREKTYSNYYSWANNGFGQWGQYKILIPSNWSQEDIEDNIKVIHENAQITENEWTWIKDNQNIIGILYKLETSIQKMIERLKVITKRNLIIEIQWYDINGNSEVDAVDLANWKLFAAKLEKNNERLINIDTVPSIVFVSNNRISEKTKNYISTITDKEIVYVDWRELIYQMALDYNKFGQDPDYFIRLEEDNPWFIDGYTKYEQYYTDLLGFWRQLYHPNPTPEDLEDNYFYPKENRYQYWNQKIHTAPNLFNFWFDFLDIESEMGQYSVDKIGDRIHVDTKSKISAIRFKDIPEAVYVIPPETINISQTAYVPLQAPEEILELFNRSAQGTSAFSTINNLIYQHVCMPENLNLTSTPIYHLQPNTRIQIKDKGDYIITKLTYNLTHNGTMQMTCNKVTKQFY